MSSTDSIHAHVNAMPKFSHDEAMALQEPRLIFMVDPDGHLGGFPSGRLLHHFINPLNRLSRDVSFMPHAWVVSEGELVGVVCSFDNQQEGPDDIRDILQRPQYLACLMENGVATVEVVRLPQPYKPVDRKLPQFKFGAALPK